MDEIGKHQLEGLLKARCDDLRHVRRRTAALDPAHPVVSSAASASAGPAPVDLPAPARTCADCAASIGSRRLRAMPAATRCLDCQRVAEAATAPT